MWAMGISALEEDLRYNVSNCGGGMISRYPHQSFSRIPDRPCMRRYTSEYRDLWGVEEYFMSRISRSRGIGHVEKFPTPVGSSHPVQRLAAVSKSSMGILIWCSTDCRPSSFHSSDFLRYVISREASYIQSSLIDPCRNTLWNARYRR